jgi:hypothetical protein
MKQVAVERFREELKGQLQSLRAGDMSPLWEQVGPKLRGGFEENFVAIASPHGGPWPPRKDSLPHPLLRKSLTLFNAVTELNASGHVADYQRREMSEGVDSSIVVYAAAQNSGLPERNLPARQFIDLGAGTITTVDPLVADYGLELLAKGGQ